MKPVGTLQMGQTDWYSMFLRAWTHHRHLLLLRLLRHPMPARKATSLRPSSPSSSTSSMEASAREAASSSPSPSVPAFLYQTVESMIFGLLCEGRRYSVIP